MLEARSGAWRRTARCALAALVLSALAACGGGGGGSGSGNGEGAGAAQGPVAGADYYPLNVGDRWLYQDGDGVTTQVDVTGTQPVQGGTALVVSTQGGGDLPDTALYLKTATGVQVLTEAGNDPTLAALGRLTLLRLPLVNGDRWVIADQTLAGVLDVDADGKADTVTLRMDGAVLGFETVEEAGRSHAQSAHVQTVLRQTVQLSSTGQTVSSTLTSDDWYAPNVGLVRSRVAISGPGGSTNTVNRVTGWRVAGQRSSSGVPTITNRLPAAGATVYGVAVQQQVGFDRPMDTGVAPERAFSLTGPDGQPVPLRGYWNDGGRTLYIEETFPLASGRYTARVSAAAVDLIGNPVGETSWTFDVDASGPQATLVSPTAGDPELPLDSVFVLQLDDDPEPASVNDSNVTLSDGVRQVEATVTLSGRTITLRPKSPLRTGARYTLAVSYLSDRNGNVGQTQYWQFTADPGRFAAPQKLLAGSTAQAVTIGDVDGDGRADAVFATGYNASSDAGAFKLVVRRGLGQGRFADEQRYTTIADFSSQIDSLTVADLDGNGRQAVVLAASGRGLQIFRQQADGTLASSQVIDTRDSYIVRVADMNGDGRPDLVSAPFVGSSVSVWLQGADGRFGAATSVSLSVKSFGDLSVGDVDGDGRPDILATSDSFDGPLGVVLRTPDGGYASPWYPSNLPSGTWVDGLAIGDVTGDGRADVVLMQTFNQRVTVLAQAPGGGFAAPVAMASIGNPAHGKVADLDGDGRNDLLVWSWGGYPIGLYRQRSDGQLGALDSWPVSEYGSRAPDLLAIGDLDGDGRPDVLYGADWLRQRPVLREEPVAAMPLAGARARAMAAAPVRSAAQPVAGGSGLGLNQRLSRLVRGSAESR